MPTKYPFDTVLTDSEQIARVWAENPTFALNEITLAKLQTKISDARQKRDRIETLRTQLTALSNELNVQTAELASINTRSRSGFRAFFGPRFHTVRTGRRHTRQRTQTPLEKEDRAYSLTHHKTAAGGGQDD